MNVTAVTPSAGGFLTVHPCGIATPNASNLNYTTGVNTANLVITRAANDGSVCIFTSQATHLIVDVVGYYSHNTAPGPSLMRTVNPGRLVDTRATGATTDNRYENTGVLVANATTTYQITNRFPVASANVAVLNITAVNPAATGFLTIWPCDQPKPNASSLNYTAGVNRAVQVLTKLSRSGTVCVSSSQTTHLIIDVNGTTV